MSARLLVLGLDGATWALLDPLASRLPNLTRLWREGVRGTLHSTTPPMTLPAWSSALTGVRPAQHGILDFVRRRPGTYDLEFLNSSHRRVPTLHRILSDRGRRVASIAVPTTWPPEPLNGLTIAGFDSPIATTVEAMHCAPRGAWAEIQRRFGGMRYADFQEGRVGAGWHEAALAALLREIGRKEAICRDLLDREDWDAFMVVFGESDTAAHHFWMFHDAASPRHQPRLRGALTAVYERLDAAVGVLARRGEAVCVLSDHGFGGAGDMALYLNRFLEREGWLQFRAASGASEGARRVALGLPLERLVRRAPPAWLGAAETRARYGAIDFTRTRAWSDELNYAVTVHLNVRGRDPTGTVGDVAGAIRELSAILLGWTVEGRRVVRRVVPATEALGGQAPGAADLIVELELVDGYSYVVLPSARVPAGTVSRRLTSEEHVGGKGLGMNGSHRPEGVLILHGAAFASGVAVEAELQDVLPTLFAAVGEAVPAHVEGRVIPGSLVGEGTAEGVSWSAPARPARRTTRAEAHLLQRQLQRLGYL